MLPPGEYDRRTMSPVHKLLWIMLHFIVVHDAVDCRPSSVDEDAGSSVVELGDPRVLAGERRPVAVLSQRS